MEVAQDANGIDLLSNNVSTPQRPTLSIPAAPELAFSDILDFMPVIEVTTGDNPQETDEVYRVSAGGIASDGFESRLCTFNECTSVKGNGSRLFLNGDEGQFGGGLGGYRYMQGGTGRQMTFDIETEYSSGAPVSPVRKFLAERIYNPGGRDLGIEYESLNVMGILRHRPVRVVSTSGYALEFEYASDTSSYEWTILARAQIVHVDAPLNVLASFDYYAGGVTDIDNRLFDCGCTIRLDPTLPEHQGSRMRLPGETADAFSTTRGSGSNVRTVTTNGVTYSYTSLPDNTWSGIDDAITRLTITGPENFYRRVNVTNTLDVGADPNSNSPSIRRRIDSVVDALGNTTTYEYDTAFNRLERIVYPEGNAISVVQDLYGNIGERRVEAKPGSSEPDIVTYASYTNGLCGIGYACFRPATTTDALGNQVEYTWENSHGGLLTQLDPADEQGRRRKTINTWSGTAPINGETCGTFNGQLGTQPFPCAPRITRTEVCEANAAGNEVTCGTANSFVQEFTYYEATSLPLTVTVTDGLGNNPLTTTYTYDDAGRVLSEDGPLPGSDDAVYYQYDILGRRIWEVGPKNEAGRRAATRTTYRTNDDQVEMVESGHVNGAANIGTFTLVRRVETDYNADRLPTHVRTYEGNLTTPENVAQTSYDSLNRAECSAIRMNPAAFGSLPASACTLGAAGAHGEDRITQTVYDNEGRTTQVIQGLGTTLERTYATYEYSDNGQMLSMTDARGFRAEMTYDGFDRQTHWYFPNPGATGVANMADYEQYTYDANGNRTQLRRRDGVLINFDYDDLGRMTRKFFPVDRPGLDPMFQRDVYYQYDIRGLQTRARFDSINGEGLTTAYDTFGRVISNTMTMDGQTRTLGYGYNAAGSRTSITFPDAVSFDYQYTSGGFFNALRIPGSVVFANYNYNQRGEVDEIQRANSAPDQQFTYDDFGRLASTGWGTTGTYDATWSFTRNPASQILTESSTNGVFAWNAHPSGTTTANYTVNGLNQYTQINGNGFCHDANGNLTADATYAYLYDNE
ncbi:hypothetical protein OOZ52_06955, partial [Aurantiacibacter sp. D1-12]|nr:hypothetical protein [Aurantiacibacter sp. D1-12]